MKSKNISSLLHSPGLPPPTFVNCIIIVTLSVYWVPQSDIIVPVILWMEHTIRPQLMYWMRSCMHERQNYTWNICVWFCENELLALQGWKETDVINLPQTG